MLLEDGFPFKSKEYSQKIATYQNSGMVKTVSDYLGLGTKTTYLCPDKLKYQFSPDFKLKISDKCCLNLKKKPAQKWAKENNRSIIMTGVRKSEHGVRQSIKSCTVFFDNNCKDLHKFYPLLVVDDEFIDTYIEKYNIELCKLYYPPFNFKRTGCKGCPFNLLLQQQLDVMELLLPNERKQCELIWKDVYEEYRKIPYRLTPEQSLFH